MYTVLLHKQALKDLEKLKRARLSGKAEALKNILAEDPFVPPFEKLSGTTPTIYSRRINIQHRMTYTVDAETHVVKILRMWTHYE